ncbi:MAG: ParB/RepB/Spo0J family partition protein [Alicyclobacillus sp.]|nr:ParB/RepB/Spo0J family partition protein [Alicyclobacillus sp.]
MPSNLVKTPHDEELWRRAKAQAAKEGHEEDWPYITSIFERMKGHTGGKRVKKGIALPIEIRKSGTMLTSSRNDALNNQLEEAMWAKSKPVSTQAVHGYLALAYPRSVIEWAKHEHWRYVPQVPLEWIQMSRRPGGRDLSKVKGMAEAIERGERMDPVVLVETDNGFKIADGYHRTLAFRHAGKKTIPAWVALGHHDKGPWDREMHEKKLNKALSDADLASRDLLERVSAMVHEQWWDWAKKIAPEIDPAHAAAWEKLFVPYEELPEQEKEKDRVFARRMIFMLQNYKPEVSKAIAQNERSRGVSSGLVRAYNEAYRKFHNEEPDEVPVWSIRAEGKNGEIWRSSDGWGYFYFWKDPQNRITHIAHCMPDVMAYHFYKPFDEYAKSQGLTRDNFKEIFGFGDAKWDSHMRRFVNGSMAKSWGDAGVKPIANAQHIGQKPNRDLLREAANTAGDEHVTPYTVYRRVMGEHARGEISVEALRSDDTGTWYRVSDGKRVLRMYQPRNGPARLVKAVTTYTPAANSVWTSLQQAGYDVKPKDGKAIIDGCAVEVKDHTVRLRGKNVQRILRTILDGLNSKQTSEAWVDGHQKFGIPMVGVQPW